MIITKAIMERNNIIYAGATIVTEMLKVSKATSTKRKIKPDWEINIERQVSKLHKKCTKMHKATERQV